MPRGQQPQQHSAIQKWTLVRPDTLQDLLLARQKGPQYRHHQPAVATVLNLKKKTRPPSPLGLVDDKVPDGAMQSSAWDIGHAVSKPRLAVSQAVKHKHAAAPEADWAPKTQQTAATSLNGPWPSTNDFCSKSWAWPGWRPVPSGADVACRSWGYSLLPDGLRVWWRPVIRVRTRTRAWKSRPE